MHTSTGPIVAATLAAAFALVAPVFAAEKTIELPSFTSVHLSSGIDATITVGGAQSIEATAPDAGVLDDMKIRVVKGKLEAWYDWSIFDIFPSNERNVVLTISVPDLAGIDASSGADITVTGMAGDSLALDASSGGGINATGISGKAISLEASSGANIDTSGSCTSANIQVSSGAHIQAKELLCESANAEASSGANANVFASKSVVADASSGGNIVVSGSPPAVESDASSGGDVEVMQ